MVLKKLQLLKAKVGSHNYLAKDCADYVLIEEEKS